ncbi:delta-1-pyrroline-5-carboxylate dehydrogenase/L-proline dehydrogenase [Mycolicibacterium canariasense]|uniref:L-glutamate gamma-semialdehyde dehydrogenase n=1 Tax=Mycolicibacterium canariasense TaxID=228230 RepID=A0A117IBK0_MYCCR|nr:bifunctional proline dehydrogenase/L-glutamate gamma-semialdehyde dehydrogenase [Mycolicibacterium canariasense]MCV7212367.1 bifunctional proline dehydrogenase/L-glutamate gamma-semialdehyde dehydrogenase [Mycolicibacterium canariasense]ORV15557.1 1-pyrroline-5-carboxylate dehydrogenase [Mycolicibacterium canariasense]GAS98059.1 delta-1-pyrroline-5-carboxylate dehydrogenase/L-proline dehydrogenase [Mycolicibacterium canariasense]
MTDVTSKEDLLTEVLGQVRSWLDDAAGQPVAPAGRQLAKLLRDPHGLDFTVGFVDRVVRPEDRRVAAANLRELARTAPGFLPAHLRLLVKLGALVSVIAPGLVIPVARKALRTMVGHLLVDATDARLGRSIARIRRRGVALNINLLGEAVLGQAEAARRLNGTERLLGRSDVDYVSIKVSATVPPHSPWAFDEAVDHIEASLLPLFTLAATSPTAKFINLDMEEYRDLELTIAVFTRLLDRPELLHLEAGIVLQAYLPDALSAMMRLQDWARARRERGGAGIKVRLVKGANLPMEHVEAALHGWPAATWPTKQDTDTNYKRVLDYALQPERTANVRIGVAGHNLFDIAYAWVLAGQRGVRDRIEFEMLLGMAEAQAEAVRRTVGGLLLYVPVVHPKDFDVAIAYLVRRLEEGASQDNFMSAVFELHDDTSLFEREKQRFVASLAQLDTAVPLPNRRQDRRTEDPHVAVCPVGSFANVADTDPALPGNRAWGRAISERMAASSAGRELLSRYTIDTPEALDRVITDTVAAGATWARLSGRERASVLRRAAGTLQAARAVLLEVMAVECGKTLDQGDPEVSEAIDFANYYASLAQELDTVDGAVAVPVGLTVVTPPWNFPVAIPAGSVLAALAAGSPVIVKPATQARRCGSLMVQALWDAGVPREVLRLVHVDESDLGTRLVSDERVGRLILTGAFDTAQLFRSFRPDLPLLAETSGKNAIVITPHADLDLAVKDLVSSAFGHAGQKCSAASLGILVGSVARSARFRDQLVDAVTSLKVGYPTDPTAQMGPVIEPADGKLLRALTQLAPGEQWLVAPRRLDETGRLWSPGVKTGVRPGSEFHLTEYFGPVLGLIAADDLDQAIAIQNQVDYGLTAGLHSLDRDEIEHWIDQVQAGNAYVNRSTVGAIVRRQPFGGWKKSAVGAGTKAGGPNYLIGLSDWRPAPATRGAALSPAASRLFSAAAGLTPDERGFLERAFASDELAWAEEFAVARDVSGLQVEQNVLRYLPVPVTVRATDGDTAALLRVVGAGIRAGAPVTVSSREPLHPAAAEALRVAGVTYRVDDANSWRELLRDNAPARVRLLGGDRAEFARDSAGRVDTALYAQPVVEAGRIELLTFVHEQAVAVTAHRFGSPTPLAQGLFDS